MAAMYEMAARFSTGFYTNETVVSDRVRQDAGKGITQRSNMYTDDKS